MKVLITGCLGHIGSSLIRYIPKKNKFNKIYIIDNFYSNRYSSLFDLDKNANYKFINCDLSKNKLENIIKENIDLVIHLAARTDAAQSSKFKKEFYSNNFNATKNIINFCNIKKAKLVFASSTSVYGPQSNIVDENCSLKELKPQSPYANVKLKEEKYIKKNLINSEFLILRLGTIYGNSPGIRFHTAVNKFCLQSSLDEPITVWKTAYNQVRPYLGLDDFNRAIIHIINNDIELNQVYNLISHNLSVKQITNIIKTYKPNLKIKFVSHEIMNQLSYEVLNNKFVNTKFKFKSNINLEIKKTLKLLSNI
tara:strand:+ start:18738 stop:19664 length:927 start_codon:yes stop_codon:yes gene_type:complete